MYREPLFFQPVFKERIWGGRALADSFGYEIPSARTGECWGISGHPHGPVTVRNGQFAGKRLDWLWNHHPELFGKMREETFPLLVKIIDAQADLSVQVHPDDEYAQKKEGEPYGKTECWYVLDCQEDAEIVFGHRAKTREELRQQVNEGNWEKVLQKKKVKPGDFFYVPSGTVHALGQGVLILEVQQSSDITYRVYDYDRTDQNGHRRPLHLEQALEVITTPHRDPSFKRYIESHEGLKMEHLIQNQYFQVARWDVAGEANMDKEARFLLLSVIAGEGGVTIDGKRWKMEKGDHLLIPHSAESWRLDGNQSLIAARPAPF